MDKLSNNAPIGVFDSGLGGLTVWREVRRALPAESLVYLGDGAMQYIGKRDSLDKARQGTQTRNLGNAK